MSTSLAWSPARLHGKARPRVARGERSGAGGVPPCSRTFGEARDSTASTPCASVRRRGAQPRGSCALTAVASGCMTRSRGVATAGRKGGGATRRSAAVEEARMLRCRPVPNPPFPTPESRPSRGAARAHSSSSRLTAGQNARPGASGAVLWPAGPVEPSHVARSAQPDATAARPRAARCRAALLLARRLSRPGPRQRCRPGHARVRLRQRREAADARGGMRCERPRARGGAEINARGEVGRTSAGSTQAASSMSN